ncbi:MAG: hypothetical protein A3B38_03635 [Candidatus Levybacteria bacterium RIFCSPLOWO2_01_FULL_36_13]|nr:MAG: hypothetical protein A2684_00570 [Candidatus Levybacteria bacterium RIFCSPHIGHO2_01_FULL_36_15b]OGH34224.1 MAG: hypothetical protein A3B38_03635 [Candidatus Levybacteria bacterium RIFCSPLOWO2_01_FULL_36_13]
MKKPALKLNSTQKFIEIIDVYEDILILTSGNASLIIEVQATNFDLLSQDEQNAKIYAYSSLLNSLSFPIQIVVRSRQLDISSYINLLAEEEAKTQNQALRKQISLYKKFVTELVKKNTVLDKKFYVVIPYSSLEKGVFGAKQAVGGDSIKNLEVQAKAALHSKAESMHTQLSRIGLKSKTLEREDLLKLFYELYNDSSVHQSHMAHGKTGIVKGDASAVQKK